MTTEPTVRAEDSERLELSDLLNHVFDKGVVIAGDVTIGIADVDLLRVSLTVVLSSVEAALRRSRRPSEDADISVLPPERGQ